MSLFHIKMISLDIVKIYKFYQQILEKNLRKYILVNMAIKQWKDWPTVLLYTTITQQGVIEPPLIKKKKKRIL